MTTALAQCAGADGKNRRIWLGCPCISHRKRRISFGSMTVLLSSGHDSFANDAVALHHIPNRGRGPTLRREKEHDGLTTQVDTPLTRGSPRGRET